MSHTVRKKHNFASFELLKKCCDAAGLKVLTAAEYLAGKYAYTRGSKETLKAVIEMGGGWRAARVEVHEDDLVYDGDNDKIPEQIKKLIDLKKNYTRETVGVLERSYRSRAEMSRVERDGVPGTLYTIEAEVEGYA